MASGQQQATESVDIKVPSGETISAIVPTGLSDQEIGTRLRAKHPEFFPQKAPASDEGDIQAHLADGRTLHFPHGTNPDVIQRTVRNLIGAQSSAPSVPLPTAGQNTSYGFGGGLPPDPHKAERLQSMLNWVEHALVNIPQSRVMAKMEQEAEQASVKGSPWEAAYKTFATGTDRDARRLLSSMTSPIGVASTIATLGEGIPAKLAAGGLGAFFGVKGAKEAMTPHTVGCYETNPLIGKHPSGATLWAGALGGTGGVDLIAYLLNRRNHRRYATALMLIDLTGHGWGVESNYANCRTR